MGYWIVYRGTWGIHLLCRESTVVVFYLDEYMLTWQRYCMEFVFSPGRNLMFSRARLR